MFSALLPLSELPLLPPKEVVALTAAGFHNAFEVLDHLPKRYEDRRRFDRFPNQPAFTPICLRGTVVDSSRRHFGKGNGYYEAVIMDGAGGLFGSGKVTCRWFNMPFMQRVVATGQEVVIYGKVKDFNGRLVMDHPEFEVLREDESEVDSLHIERIVPIYRNVSGIAQRRLREIMHLLLLQSDPATLVGRSLLTERCSRVEALNLVHFPPSLELAQEGRRRLALEEFFSIQLNVAWRRARQQEHMGRVLGRRTTMLTSFYNSLPFDLTGAQKRSIHEIVADMRKAQPMNRLLQGDVGAGKTFVAMAAMLLAIDSGCQAAMMAPTQILAEQHYLTFRRWLEPLGVRLALRTGNRNEGSHLELDGPPQIIIGTHALLYDRALFDDLGLVVIDEQHKFGVAQRASLIQRGVMPDVLVMTATPIPRTLTMTIYGDLDVSLLDEKPAGRGKLVTAVRVGAKQSDINAFIKEQLAKGRQAYLVYPLVEESENVKAEAATVEHAKWCKRLSSYEVGLIHGKLKPEEKEQVMARFREGKTAALVATSVIEVGVDVPNASVMLLHNAERFGLAQIHLLRGRIGRGGHKGYCVLLTDGKNLEAMEKLNVLAQSSDGFEIAEADLRLRGPGDVLGTMQSGLSDIQFVDFLADTDLLKEARELAEKVLHEDPMLDAEYRSYKSLIQETSELGSNGTTA